MKIHPKIITALLISACLFPLSCATVSGRLQSAERTAGKGSAQLLLIKENAQQAQGELTAPFIPGITLYGEIDETAEGFSFLITGIHMFANWPQGWTDGKYEASGSILFRRDGDQYTASTGETFEIWDISQGEIRYYDTFFRNDEGLWKVKNRIDRIIELIRFLKEEKEFPSFLPDQNDLSLRIVPFLFPEGKKTFKRKERKLLFSEVNTLYNESEEEYAEGAGLKWNTVYSGKILPENLRPLRDSGTLWRDYEEARQLFFSLYNLEYFTDHWTEGKVFTMERSRK